MLTLLLWTTVGCTPVAHSPALEGPPAGSTPDATSHDSDSTPAAEQGEPPSSGKPRPGMSREDRLVMKRRGGAGAVYYEIELSPSGDVRWMGVNDVARDGAATGKVSQDVVADAWRTLSAVDVDQLGRCRAYGFDHHLAIEFRLVRGDEIRLLDSVLDGTCPDNEAHQTLRRVWTSLVEQPPAHDWIGETS